MTIATITGVGVSVDNEKIVRVSAEALVPWKRALSNPIIPNCEPMMQFSIDVPRSEAKNFYVGREIEISVRLKRSKKR